MSYREETFLFDCDGDSLVGVVALPERTDGHVGVVVVVGGPQYRAGSHRQFVLLSRALAAQGIPCLRFDYRGMGDSEGDPREFTDVDADIRAAIDAFLQRTPGLSHVVLWGLCDGASAAAFYAPGDERVHGLVLLNPWVHTEQAEARVYLKRYYWQRVTSAAFWRKLLAGRFDPGRAARDGLQLIRRAFSGDKSGPGTGDGGNRGESDATTAAGTDGPLPERLYSALSARPVDILFLLSGRDFVANEFEDLVKGERRWSRLLDHCRTERLPDADHTFSDPAQADRAATLTIDWVRSL